MVNPASSVKNISRFIYSKHGLVSNAPSPDKNTCVYSLEVTKTFVFAKEAPLPTSVINIWLISPMFYAFVQGSGSEDSTNQSSLERLNFMSDLSKGNTSGKL